MPRRLPRSAVFTMLGLCAGVAITLAWVAIEIRSGRTIFHGPDENKNPVAIPALYNADRAFGYLEKICSFGPRKSGSPAMAAQIDFLESFFTERGASVSRQAFEVRDPQSGEPVPIVNLISVWNADAANRILLCAHYDTRPFPDNDPRDPKGVFVGANDGASGTAALMEWSHRFAELPESIGVDIVLFDGEELVYNRNDTYFLGSTYFAQTYAESPTGRYKAGVLLDMVGDRELKLFYERNSLSYAPELTREIWSVAHDLGVRSFVPRVRHNVRDDHLPLNNIAKIPTVDIIDFDYPRPGAPTYWHTTNDVPRNCSGRSLATVVYVLDQWLANQQ